MRIGRAWPNAWPVKHPCAGTARRKKWRKPCCFLRRGRGLLPDRSLRSMADWESSVVSLISVYNWTRKDMPQGLKALVDLAVVAARLKSRPFKTGGSSYAGQDTRVRGRARGSGSESKAE